MKYMYAQFRRCDPPILTTPPTALTAHSRGFKFGMDTHLGNTFGVIEGIFEIPPLSRDMGVGRFHPWGVFPPISQLRGRNSKIASMVKVSINANFQVCTMFGVGCRGGGPKIRGGHIF